MNVLVQASERLKASDFRGVTEPGQKVRKGKQHLKFPLYLDAHIGLESAKSKVYLIT